MFAAPLPSQEHTMRRLVLSPIVFATAYAGAASAQTMKRSDLAGTWEVKTDSGVASVIRVSANGKRWTLTFAGRKPIALRVIASGGDSVVIPSGRVSRGVGPGQTVTRVREDGPFSGDPA